MTPAQERMRLEKELHECIDPVRLVDIEKRLGELKAEYDAGEGRRLRAEQKAAENAARLEAEQEAAEEAARVAAEEAEREARFAKLDGEALQLVLRILRLRADSCIAQRKLRDVVTEARLVAGTAYSGPVIGAVLNQALAVLEQRIVGAEYSQARYEPTDLELLRLIKLPDFKIEQVLGCKL